MTEDRIHRAVSDDGTELTGRVYGTGPPLVLVSGIGDGENAPFLVPQLSERFTCYSMSLPGRGRSGAGRDHAPDRLVEDVTAFIDSVGEPAGLAGHSRGAALALGAAAKADAVSAVAVYEPHVIEFYTDEHVARAERAFERMQAAADEGDAAAAAKIFFQDITLPNQDEPAILAKVRAFDSMGPNVPTLINDISQWHLPRPGHTLQLEHATMPVLLMHGTGTHAFYKDVTHRLAERLPNSQTHELAGAGHFSPMFAPEPIAERLLRFLDEELEPA